MITIKKGLFVLLTSFVLSACMSSSPNPENSFASVSGDTLENGLTYAIHAKRDNSQKIQLRLFVQSGSLSETEEQKGYAHLLEHMAFNGTKSFPKNKIIELFEKSGLTFGHDINAYTSFTETVYTLSVPVGDKALLSDTMLYLREVLNDIEFDQAELEKEQGVVQNEFRARTPQEPPYYYAIFSDYIADSEYEAHLPIGTLESVGNSTEQGVKAFYKQWYRPNNAKLLITGDVDSELAKQLIVSTFGDIKKSDNQQTQVVPDAPKLKTKSKAFSSQVINFSQTDLVFEVPTLDIKNSEQLSQAIKLDMLDKMVNYRLNVLNAQRKTPFNNIAFSYAPVLNNKSFKNISTSYQGDNVTNSVTFIAQELARLNQHGFSQAEFDLQYEMLQTEQKQLKNNFLNQTSAQIANDVIHAWATDSAIFTYELKQQAYQKALASLTLNEINQLTKTLIKSPKKLTFAYTDVAYQPDFLNADNVFAKHFNKEIDDTEIKIEKMVLPVAKINTGITPIKSERFYSEKNITQIALNNGVAVLLQPDNSVKDSISMSFTAPGGLNSLTGKEIAARNLLIDSYMKSGLAGLSPQRLNQVFDSANASLMPVLDWNAHGFNMQSINNPESLKLVFSMLYSIMNDATIKAEIFSQEKSNLIEQQKIYLAQPTTDSLIKAQKTLFPNYPLRQLLTIEEIESIQQSEVESLHKRLFGSANGYKLTIVGDFNVDEMKALIVEYIAVLESGKLHQFNQQPQSLIQQATQLNEFTNPQNNAMVEFITITDTPNKSIKEVYQATLLQGILSKKLLQVVREELSLTYSPHVNVMDQQAGNAFTQTYIQTVTKVEDAQQTQSVINKIIKDFLTNGITHSQLTENQHWLSQLMLGKLNKSTDKQWFLHRDHLQGFELESTANAKAIVESISVEDMNQFIKTYLDPTKTLQMINLPQQD